MGKASRKKKSGPDPKKQIRDAIKRTGVSRASISTVWDTVERRFDGDQRASLLELADAIDREEMPADGGYSVLWQNVETARATWPLVAAPAEEFLKLVATRDPGPRLVDVGSGMGVIAAVLAQLHPDTQVVGVEPSEEGISVSRQIASELRLDNLRFVRAPIEELTPELVDGAADTVVCSLVLAAAGYFDVLPPLSDPFSVLDSVDEIERSGVPAGVQNLGAIASDGSQLWAFERCPGAEVAAHWLAWIQGAGFAVTERHGLHAEWQVLDAVIAQRGAEPKALRELLALRPGPEVEVELRLREMFEPTRNAGLHVWVSDEDGEGQTKIEAIESSGEHYVLMRTSRGARDLQTVSSRREAEQHVQMWRDHVEADPSVVRTQILLPGRIDG